MTTRHIIEIDSLMLLGVSALVGMLFAVASAHKPTTKTSFPIPVMQSLQNPFTNELTPSPTPLPKPKVETSSQVSPDGTKKLLLTVTTNPDTSTYAFTTSDGQDGNQQSLYTTTLPLGSSLAIPFNTWSPDDAYVFLEQKDATRSSALVMKADGQPLGDGTQYRDIGTTFSEKNTGNAYQETTGWASNTLLIVNSTQSDGTKGPSYWFEAPSQAITQLSTSF